MLRIRNGLTLPVFRFVLRKPNKTENYGPYKLDGGFVRQNVSTKMVD